MKKKYLSIISFFIIVSFSFAHEDKIDSLKILLKTNVSDTIKLKRMMDVVWNSYRTFPEQSINIAKDALSLSKKLNRFKDEAKCENFLGIIFSTIGNYDSASFYYTKSLKIGLKYNNAIIILKAYNNIGLNYYYQGIYDKALENYFNSLELAEKLSDTLGIANTYANIGNTYIDMKSTDNALNYLNKALIIFEKLGYKRGIANVLNSIGSIYSDTDSLIYRAKDSYQRSLKIKEDINDRFGVSNTLNQIADLYYKEKNYEKEIEFYKKTLEIKHELGDKSGITKTLVNLGKANNSLKRYNESFPYFFEALKISDETGSYSDKLQVYLGLSITYSKMKNFEKALEYRLLYSAIRDTIMNQEKSKQITEMQTKYETEKKQKENEILVQENTIKSLEINQQKNQRTILISIFAFLLIAGFFIFNRIRLKQENKILLEKKLRASSVFQAQEKEKVHLSKELHDGLGPLLSLIKLNVSSLVTNDGNEKMLNEIKELASEGMKEVRNISHTLMPTLLEKQGLEPALREFTLQIEQSQILKTDLTFNISTKLSKEAELNVYRIVQETLNNTIKHAEANSASISLSENKLLYELTISDDGKGFDINKISEGNGLNNIYSRIDFLNGKAEIKSIPEKGTTFIISIPKKELI